MRLGDVLQEFKAKTPTGAEPPVLTLTERQGFVLQSDRFNKRLATEDTSSYKYIERDDFAFNPYLLWAGAISRNDTFDCGVISPLYPTFRARAGFSPAFLGRILLSPSMIKRYDSIAFGSVPRRRRSSVENFLNLEIPDVPAIKEQLRIADILDKADTLRANRREAIAHLDSLGQSIFHEMFGSPHAPRPPFKSVPLMDCVALKSGGTPARNDESFWGGNVPWFSPKDVKRSLLTDSIEHISASALEKTSAHLFPRNTVVFVVRGMILAHTFPVAITEVPGTINQDMKAVVPRDGYQFSPHFVAANLNRQSSRVLKNAESSAHGTKRLGPNAINDIVVVDAPVEAQLKFERRIKSIERQRLLNQTQLAELDNLFLSLQDRAFKGEL